MRNTTVLAIPILLLAGACAEPGPTEPLAPADAVLDLAAQVAGKVEPHGRPMVIDAVMGQDLSAGTCDVPVPTGDPQNPTVLVQIPRLVPAWGTATHMGKISQQIWHDECSFALHDDLPVIELDGHFRVQAANGDTTEGTWSGYLLLAGPQSGHFFNTGWITGGTGRFENASGELAIQGWKNLGQGTEPSWYRAEGTIYY